MKTLQQKLEGCLPEERIKCICLNYKQTWSEIDGYNECIQDVKQALPKMVEILEKEIEKNKIFRCGR